MRGFSSGPLPRGAALRLLTLGLLLATAAAQAEHDPYSRGFDAVPVKPTAAQRSGIDGRVSLQPGALNVSAKLGFLLGAMKGSIEHEIRRVLEERFGRA